MTQEVDEGDVFSSPLGDGRCGVGQVVATYQRKGLYYFAIYDCVVDGSAVREMVDDALSSRVMFLALSLDSRLHHGIWTVVARRDVPADLPFPAYKEDVGWPIQVHVVDYLGQRLRPASHNEAALLPYRKTVAPIILEKALQAKAGLTPWIELFNELAPEESLTTERLFG